MLRLIVIALLAANLMLAGFNAASNAPERPVHPVKVSRLPTGLPGIPLMSELEDYASPLEAARQCFTVGPFETERSLQSARQLLQPLTVEVSERTTEALMELGYWVALPAYANFTEAAGAERDLRRAGLDDIAVVTDPAGQVLVSLGYFLDENNARRRRDQVRDLGFEAVTRLQRESQPRFWLDYEQAAGVQLASEALQQELSPGRHRSTPCASSTATNPGA